MCNVIVGLLNKPGSVECICWKYDVWIPLDELKNLKLRNMEDLCLGGMIVFKSNITKLQGCELD